MQDPKFRPHGLICARYSQAPFENPQLRAHWGEPLVNKSRELLKDDFDHPSITSAQTYVLLATYHFTFGGMRKAWLSLGFARTIINLLQLDQNPPGTDPFQDEISRRLVATIGLMENLFTPSVNISRGLQPISPLPMLYSDEDFDLIKARALTPSRNLRKPALMNEILQLSDIFFQIRKQWSSVYNDTVSGLKDRLRHWEMKLPTSFIYSEQNMEHHLRSFQIRPFVSLHLLYHHVWQILLFESLTWPPPSYNPTGYDSIEPSTRELSQVYHHAIGVAEIISRLWELARSDIQNPCFAQIAITTTVILAHRLLSTRDAKEREHTQDTIKTVYGCILRVQHYCRLFNWVVRSFYLSIESYNVIVLTFYRSIKSSSSCMSALRLVFGWTKEPGGLLYTISL